jgi:tetratricopeptide (TPR) repeat protein
MNTNSYFEGANAFSYIRNGNVLFAAGKYEEAIEQYKEALKRDENYTDAYFNWGLALGNLNKNEEAIEQFRQVLKRDENYKEAYNNWGLALKRLKRPSSSTKKCSSAMRTT